MMKRGPVAETPGAYAKALRGWRRKRLRAIEPRLKPGGRYEMATVELREGDAVEPKIVARLAREAVALNERLGDPTKLAKR